jgi:hypothetical protein
MEDVVSGWAPPSKQGVPVGSCLGSRQRAAGGRGAISRGSAATWFVQTGYEKQVRHKRNAEGL